MPVALFLLEQEPSNQEAAQKKKRSYGARAWKAVIHRVKREDAESRDAPKGTETWNGTSVQILEEFRRTVPRPADLHKYSS